MTPSRGDWRVGLCSLFLAACSSSGPGGQAADGAVDGAADGDAASVDGPLAVDSGSGDGGSAPGCARAADAADASPSDVGREEVARVEETASSNTPAIEVVVYSDGSAERRWGGAACPVDLSYPAGSPTVTRFLADVAAAGDVSQIPTTPCTKSVSFGTETTVTAGGKTSGDLQCLATSAPAAARSLAADAAMLEDGH